jgi:hypothetical protein
LKEEHTALPDLGNEVDPILKKAFPGKSRQQIDRLKSIFLSKELPGTGGTDGTFSLSY